MNEPRHDKVADIAGTDTREGESTLSSAVLDLLAAIRDALTVPRPARCDDITEYWERRRQREQIIADRATSVRIAAHVAVDLAASDLEGTLTYLTRTIRDSTDAITVDYEVQQDGGAR
jgi:hypothetical protein